MPGVKLLVERFSSCFLKIGASCTKGGLRGVGLARDLGLVRRGSLIAGWRGGGVSDAAALPVAGVELKVAAI